MESGFRDKFYRKVLTLRTIIRLAGLITLFVFTSCQMGPRELFVVDFKENSALRYQLVSERDIELSLGEAETTQKSRKQKTQKMSEKFKLVMSYKPIKVDPYGLTRIEATCESVYITRRSFAGKKTTSDAVKSLRGKTYAFKITPTGKFDDYESLQKVVRELGNKAFTQKVGKQGRVKDPDMISDFVALQWYFWDSTSTIEKPIEGAAIGQSWKALQLIPLPMPRAKARETTYKLSEIKEAPDGRRAVITSSYALSDQRVENRPKAYSGKFRMKGMFGFLRNYRMKSLSGTGTQIFNLDTGQIESEQQQYQVDIEADFLMPLGDTKPRLMIQQKLKVKLLD